MENVVVVYRSKYGATRQYAQWLATDLRCESFDLRKIQVEALEDYDTIIYGGAVYASGVLGVKFLRKNIELLGKKNLVLFTCGLADPHDGKTQRDIQARLIKTLTDEVLEHIRVFHLRGAINYAALKPHHKMMMAMRHRLIVKKDPSSRTEDDRQFLATYGKSVDFRDKEAIRPIVEYVRELSRGVTGSDRS